MTYHHLCTHRCASGPCMLFSLTEAAICCSCTSRAEQAKRRLCSEYCLGLSKTTDRDMKGRRDTSWVQQTCKLAMVLCANAHATAQRRSLGETATQLTQCLCCVYLLIYSQACVTSVNAVLCSSVSADPATTVVEEEEEFYMPTKLGPM